MSVKLESRTLHFDLSDHSQDHEFTLLAGGGRRFTLNRYADHPNKLDEHINSGAHLTKVPESHAHKLTHFVENAMMSAQKASIRRVVFPSLDDHPLPEIAQLFLHTPEDHVEIALRRLRRAGITPRAHMSAVHFGVDPDEYEAAFATQTLQEQAKITASWNSHKNPHDSAVAIVLHHPELYSVQPGVLETINQSCFKFNQDMNNLAQTIRQMTDPDTGQPAWYNKSWALWAESPFETDPSADNPSQITWETDPSKIKWVHAKANTDLKTKSGEKLSWPELPDKSGPGLPLYNLTDEFDPPRYDPTMESVVEASAPVVRSVLLQSKNNMALAGQLWNVQQGVTNESTGSTTSAPKPTVSDEAIEAGEESQFIVEAAAPETATSGFTAKNKTTMYGLKTYPLKWDNSTKQLTVPVKNWPDRYLGVYVEFLKEDGTPIKRSDLSTKVGNETKPLQWESRVPLGLEYIKPWVELSETKNYLTWLCPGNEIMGVTVSKLTQIEELKFLWPDQASKARLLFGGLGAAEDFKDWDFSVDFVGAMGSSVLSICINVMTMQINESVSTFTNPFINKLKDQWGASFYIVVMFLGLGALATGIAGRKTATGKWLLSHMSDKACSTVVGAAGKQAGKQFQKMQVKDALKEQELATERYLKHYDGVTEDMVASLTEEEIAEQIPVAGWALRIAAVTASILNLAETTTDIFESPSTFEIDIQRTMNLTVRVSPDPTHGKPGFAPVWPAVADHWICQVKYPGTNGTEGGTTYTMAGPLEGGTAGDQTVEFKNVPSGGKIDVVFGVYSESNWLAGQWTSGWVNALPDANDAMSFSGAIKELIVPLSKTTTYSQHRTLGYNENAKHFWVDVGFSVDSSLTPDFDKGGAPDTEIRNAFTDNGNTLTSQANIVVNTAGENWTMTDNGLGAVFAVKQHQIFSGNLFEMKADTYASSLNQGGTPDSALQDEFNGKNYPLPPDAVITVDTAGSCWTIATKGQPPAYMLVANGSNIDVSQTLYELQVANTLHALPSLPASYPVPAPTGQNIGELLNIVHNNHEFELGYSYQASGQNLPFFEAEANTQDEAEAKTKDGKVAGSPAAMYLMQSISTLGSPQEQIYTPTGGYIAPSFIAFDQFGLTPLFTLSDKYQSDLRDGAVPEELAAEFAAFGHTLPADAVISTEGKDWRVGEPGQVPLYEIRVTQTQQDSKTINQLSIYDYPVPGLDNFVLVPDLSVENEFHLKGVDLAKPPGEYTFETASTDIWGVFLNSSAMKDVAVHPNGFVIGLDELNGKLFILKLPAKATARETAPMAKPLSGLGSRQGLIDGPQALNVTADGRILVLETGTYYITAPRIQAFDTMGNPVPSFSVGQPSMTIDNAASYATEFDNQTVSQGLMNQFQENFHETLAPKVTLAPTSSTSSTVPTFPPEVVQAVVSDLDNGKVDQTLIDVMAQSGLTITGATDASENTTSSDFTVSVTEPGALWYVTDTTSKLVYDVRLEKNEFQDGDLCLDLYLAFDLNITQRSPGNAWRIEDNVNAETYEASYDKKTEKMKIQRLCSWMPLREQSPKGTLTYLDLSSETKGYIYVLSVIDNNYDATKNPEDLTFQLDIYSPDGTVLLDKPQTGINAGKITVDQYRTLYTLNFEQFTGPNTRPEPGVSQWTPSTPNEATPGAVG